MILDWILAGLAFLGTVLALGKYASRSNALEKHAQEASCKTCLCLQCAHFKAKEKDSE